MTDNPIHPATINREHFFLSQFTLNLIHVLTSDTVFVNLTGPQGGGKTRLLLDIDNSTIPGTSTAYIDFNQYVTDFDGFLQRLLDQIPLPGPAPKRLSEIFKKLEKTPTCTILLFDHCDGLSALLKHSPGYDANFFADLNSIKSYHSISLVCTTNTPIDLPLDFTVEELPNPDRRDLLGEFKRRLDEYDWLWLKTNPDEKELLLKAVLDQPLPFRRLCYFSEGLNGRPYSEKKFKMKKALRKWKKEFKKSMQ
ncbi:MAG: hypothetical protein GY765_27055 [bacterium]|nr:hypothetical protein [bacterium]